MLQNILDRFLVILPVPCREELEREEVKVAQSNVAIAVDTKQQVTTGLSFISGCLLVEKMFDEKNNLLLMCPPFCRQWPECCSP